MSNQLSFYQSGNGRLVGRAVHDQTWQQTLASIDHELNSFPVVRLANQDVIFRWQEDGLWVYRSIIGFLSKSVLNERGLKSVDFSDHAIAAWQSKLQWASELDELKVWCEDQLKLIQHTDFPENYGEYDTWQLKLKMIFSDSDKVDPHWVLEAFFAHGSSSIFAF